VRRRGSHLFWTTGPQTAVRLLALRAGHPLLPGRIVVLISVGGTLINFRNANSHVKWAPCHHGMARHYVVDGGDGLQIWRVAADILHMQSRRAKKRWSSSSEVVRKAITPNRKNKLLNKCHLRPWTWTDPLIKELSKGKRT
jgi:hypothetical protein